MPINPHNPFKGRHYPGGPGGWQFGGIVTLQSGSPFRITQSADTQNNDSVGAARPDLVPGQTISLSDRDPSRWFNTAAFTASVFHLETRLAIR